MTTIRTMAQMIEPLVPEAEMTAMDARRRFGSMEDDARRVFVMLHAVLMLAARLRQTESARHLYMRASALSEMLDDQLRKRKQGSLTLLQVCSMADDFLADIGLKDSALFDSATGTTAASKADNATDRSGISDGGDAHAKSDRVVVPNPGSDTYVGRAGSGEESGSASEDRILRDAILRDAAIEELITMLVTHGGDISVTPNDPDEESTDPWHDRRDGSCCSGAEDESAQGTGKTIRGTHKGATEPLWSEDETGVQDETHAHGESATDDHREEDEG